MAHVLIVDDEPVILSTFSKALKHQHHRVWTAANAHKAFPMLLNNRIDVVVSDIVMPGMNGISLMELILRHWPEVKVILVTGHPSSLARDQAQNSGASHFLVKPVPIGVLRTAVDEALQEDVFLNHASSPFQSVNPKRSGL